MPKFRPTSIVLSLVLSCLALILTSCGNYNQPDVTRGNGYEAVEIGPFEYIAPSEFPVISSGEDYVLHQCSTIPGSPIRVESETTPPRSLKIDADSAKRKFLKELPKGFLSSSQYHEKDGRETITIFFKGKEKENKLYAILTVLREDQQTIRISQVAPLEYKEQMLDANKKLVNLIELK